MSMTYRLAVIALSFLPLVRSGNAARVEFVAWYGGQRVEQAEVCFFPGDARNQFRSYFQSNAVRCLPADQVHEIPVGAWHFYARHRRGLVSDWPGFIDMNRPVDGYRRVRVDLVPAATLSLRALKDSLRKGEHAVIYFPSEPAGKVASAAADEVLSTSGDRLPFLFPVTTTEDAILVPAGRTFVPIIAANAVPIWIGAPQQVSNKGEVTVDRKPGRARSVVAWITFDREELRRFGWPKVSVKPPQVFVRTQNGRRIDARFPVRYFGETDLIIVPGLSELPAEIVVEGDGWRTVSRTIETRDESQPIIALTQPLHATLLSGLVVQVPFESADGVRSCGEEPAAKEPAVSLWSCPGEPVPANASVTGGCSVVQGAETVAKGYRTVRFQNLEAGRYWITVSSGGAATRWHEPVDIASGERLERFVQPKFSVVSGRVTQDGRPVHAQVRFATGFSFSDSVTGYYRAPVTRDPGNKQVEIKPCDSEQIFRDFPDRELRSGDVFDIELPTGPLTLQVFNAVTGAPIEDADCTLSVGIAESPMRIVSPRTDAAGLTAIAVAGSATRALKRGDATICCEHAAFEKGCINYETKTPDIARIDLRPAAHVRIKISAKSPIVGGRLYWVSPVAGSTELSNVESDGSVVRQRPLSPEEYGVFVSRSHPLQVWPAATLLGGSVSVTEAGVALQVVPKATRNEATSITIALGPMVVPSAALTFHQAMRRQPVELTPAQTMVIPDIVPSAPLFVMVGYRQSETPATAGGFEPDYFLLPEHRRAFLVLPVGPNLRVEVP